MLSSEGCGSQCRRFAPDIARFAPDMRALAIWRTARLAGPQRPIVVRTASTVLPASGTKGCHAEGPCTVWTQRLLLRFADFVCLVVGLALDDLLPPSRQDCAHLRVAARRVGGVERAAAFKHLIAGRSRAALQGDSSPALHPLRALADAYSLVAVSAQQHQRASTVSLAGCGGMLAHARACRACWRTRTTVEESRRKYPSQKCELSRRRGSPLQRE